MFQSEFAEAVRKNWGNPLGLGKLVLEQTHIDGRFRPADDQIERALEIGMIVQETRESGPEEFLRKFEEMAMTALCE